MSRNNQFGKSVSGRNFVRELTTNRINTRDVRGGNRVGNFNSVDAGGGNFGTLSTSYFINYGPTLLQSETTVTADGAGKDAIDLNSMVTYLDTSGGTSDLTLAEGAVGQMKIITMTVSGSAADLDTTDGNLVSTITNINWSAIGDTATLLYTDVGWTVTGSYGVTITP